MTNSVTWDDLVLIVRGLLDRQIGPPVRGNFLIVDKIALDALKACLESETETHLRLSNDEDPVALTIGQTVGIEVSPRFGFGLLINDVDALLQAQHALVKEPHHFFLLENSIASADTVGDEHSLARYRAVLGFIQTLKRASAFLDSDEPALIFIKDGKFEVPINYSDDDLSTLSLADLHALTNIFTEGTHERQCGVIMADAIVDMTRHLPTYNRFQYLLANLSDLKKRYEDGYNLFASGFSYEKVRDEVEAARIEYTGKIHKVFSDVQNQLLSIPVATIIVATQMKGPTAVGYEFWINTAVLIGCWVFAALMVLLLHNQSHTLDVIRDEIDRQKRQLEMEFAAVAKSFERTFTYLSRRALTQRIILWAIDGIVVLGLLLSHLVYFKLTPPARDWLIKLVPLFSGYL
jgi:hypothetical protein